jgi:CSLREA domain-containing protein
MTSSSLFYKLLTAMVLIAMALVALPASPAYAASITVNITTDENANNANCSLREAIIAANNNASYNGCIYTGTGPDDTITLTSGQTYVLSIGGSSPTTGDLDVGNDAGTSGDLTIQASGAGNAIIDADDINRVFEVTPAGDPSLTLINITVTDGNAPDGAGIYFAGNGTLTLTDSAVTSNVATGSADCGAGIWNDTDATVVIEDSLIDGNSCSGLGSDGAGLFKGGGGSLTITNSTFSKNSTVDNGGGVHIDMLAGTATITNSTFANNTAGGRGGGLQVANGSVTVEFSTFSENAANMVSASTGGAVQSTGGTVSVLRSILANSTSGGSPTQDCDQLNLGAVSITNSLVESNSDCTGTITSSSDPGLGNLGNNGGPTPTMAIGNTSPAYNAALSCGSVATDQRGVARPQDAACDLGAFEFQAGGVDPAPTVTSVTRADANPTNAASVNFTVTFSEPVTGVDVTDFDLTTTGAVSGASVTGVSGSGSTYTVTVNRGTGNGTIQLDVLDDDSIEDAGGNPLAGGFTTGEAYTIQTDAIAPTVVSVTRADANPTNAASVNFTVTFSEPVTGVDVTDFALTTTGAISGASVTGVSGSGAVYTVTVNTGNGDGTIRLDVLDDNSIVDASNNLLAGEFTSGEAYTVDKGAIFDDVPESYWAWSFVERLYNAGITGGCATNPLRYCPDNTVTRAEMAVFLLRGIHGSSYTPPAVGATTGFADVPTTYWAAAWIKQLAAEGITTGCGNGNYCPDAPVTRAEMAVFLLRSEHGTSYSPPAVGSSTGFTDVPTTYWAAAWIKQLVVEGITSGCGPDTYCPEQPVTRAQMAVFLVRTFSLP